MQNHSTMYCKYYQLQVLHTLFSPILGQVYYKDKKLTGWVWYMYLDFDIVPLVQYIKKDNARYMNTLGSMYMIPLKLLYNSQSSALFQD